MIDSERGKLGAEQDILMKMYEEVEAEPEEYKNFRGLLNLLDERAELNRCDLEGRWLNG